MDGVKKRHPFLFCKSFGYSIARAMLKDAPIIILDEATASVDPENEHEIQAAISALVHGKTIITIAHRLTTIENADQILVVEDGRIVQRGIHTELIRQEGLYRRFIKIRQETEGWRMKENELKSLTLIQ